MFYKSFLILLFALGCSVFAQAPAWAKPKKDSVPTQKSPQSQQAAKKKVVKAPAHTLKWEAASFVDPRTQYKYRTVRIAHLEWLAENVRYELPQSWCYEGLNQNCQSYGRLYSWHAAQFACPEGWALPSISDWAQIFEWIQDSKKGISDLLALEWNGSNQTYFNILPSGLRSVEGRFIYQGRFASFWTVDFSNAGAKRLTLNGTDESWIESMDDQNVGCAIRCFRQRPKKGMK